MTQPGQPGYDPTIADWANRYDVKENPLKHGIDESVPGGAFASVSDPAWHNLGVVSKAQVTALELLKLSHGDYDVFLVDDYAITSVPVTNDDGEPIMIGDQPFMKEVRALDPYKKKICRWHPTTKMLQVLGTGSFTYQPINARELFIDFADKLIDVSQPTVCTSGVLYDGRQQFMGFKLPKGVTVDGNDGSELWMVAHTSHDLSVPSRVSIVPIRPVCRNTLRVGLRDAKSRWEIKHTRNAKMVLAQAREALKLGYEYADEWGDVMKQLAATRVSTARFEDIVTTLWGPEDGAKKRTLDAWDQKRATLLDLFTTAPTAAGPNGWGALNAVTEYCDWNTQVITKSFRAESATATGDDVAKNAARFWRSLDGEKSVTNPKMAMLRSVAEFAGVKV